MKKANFTNQSFLPKLKLVFSVMFVALTFAWSNAQTFSGSTTNTAGNSLIPSAGTGGCTVAPQTTGGTDFPLQVGCVGNLGGGVVVSSVQINLTHTWDADLDIYLVSPSGAVLELSTGNGGSLDNYTNTVFSDNPANPFITAGAAPFTGTFRPEGRQNLATCAPVSTGVLGTFTLANTFNSGSADGEWKLRFFDNAGGDSGTLLNWSITFSGAAVPTCSIVGGPTLPALNLSTAINNCESNPIAFPATSGTCTGLVRSYRIGSGPFITLAPGATTIPGLPSGSYTITWRVVNSCAQVNTATQVVNVADEVDPVITCPAPIFVNLGPGACNAFVNYTVTATDNCPFAGPSGQVNTINTGGNGNSVGGMVFFNITNLTSTPITITAFGMNISGATTVNVYTKTGTHVGFETNAGAWTLAGTANANTGPFSGAFPGNGTITPAPTNIVLQPGLTGIGLHTLTASSNYTNGTGANQTFTDGNITLNLGSTSNTQWGAPFTPRVFNGYVAYQTPSVSADPIKTSGLASGSVFPIGTTENCFSITDVAGNTSNCCFNVTVNAFPNPTTTLTCNDLVQVSLNENCTATLGADQILEGGPYGCYDTRYTVMVLSPTGANLGNTVNQSFIGPQWTVKVTDNVTGNSCWGKIIVEDKIKPIVQCEDLELPCTAPSTAVGATANFSTVNTPVNILDLQTVTANIPVSGLPADARILDVNVKFDINHTWIGDLDIDIISPSGTRFRAWNQLCGATQNFKVTMDDEDPDCLNACAAYNVNDTVKPPACLLAQFPGFADLDFLDVFDGEAANGNWTVRVEDFFGADQGVINNVTLTIKYFSATAVYQPTVIENCSGFTLSKVDAIIESGCNGPARTIKRTWTATDAQGNVSAPCVQTITFTRPTLDDVEIPADIVWTCVQYNQYPNIIDSIPLNPNIAVTGSGIPTVSGRPLAEICDIGYQSSDIRIDICPGTFKIVRKWTLIDWCSSPIDVREFNQVIKVVDDIAPTFDVPASTVGQPVNIDVYNASAPSGGPHAVCVGSVVVPPATNVNDVCSGVASYTTEIWTVQPTNGQPGTQIATIATNGGIFNNIELFQLGLPARYVVRYYVIDKCGNQAFKDLYIRLRDKVPPVAVCDEITEVAITNNSNSTGGSCSALHASSLDDGSYDNCTPVYFLIARMPANSTQVTGLCYYPSLDFCCSDVGTSVNVIVLVLDGDPKLSNAWGPLSFGCGNQALRLTAGLDLIYASGPQAGQGINWSACMVSVNVVDKLPPVLVNCPANTRITCDKYASELQTALFPQTPITGAQQAAILTAAGYGSPTYYDNCSANVTANTNVNLDLCLEGTITRTWSVQDGSGNNGPNCTQTIWVDHVSDWAVEFPEDKVYECEPGISLSQVDSLFGVPKIFNETCELVGTSYTDEIFNVVPDACYKVLRTWTVINWCVVGAQIDQEVVELSEAQLWNQGVTNLGDRDINGDGFFNAAEVNSNRSHRTYRDSWNNTPGKKKKPTAADNPTGNQSHSTVILDPDTDPDSDPWDGYITYQQTIKVKDSVAPKFVNGCQIPDVCITDNTCGAAIVIPTPAIEDCSPAVTVTSQIRIGGVWFNGANPIANVAPGTYEVRYNAIDKCNNQQDCNTTVTVKDCKKPTPYCKNGLVVEIMQTGMVQLWASDFDAGSFDNCTPQSQLKLSFSPNVNETGRTYTCDSLGQRVVRLWVTDLAGNQDFCETFVEIQDNMGACDDDPQIAGVIATQGNQGVQNVSVNVNSTTGFGANTLTNANGAYNVNVPSGGDYTITPVLDVNPLNGVSTFDLVLISKHILGVELLNSPYKIIAADANKSNSVTTFDLVEIRKLILFINTDFPNNTSWRFVKKSHTFANPANPFASQFPEVINLNNLTASALANDFVAVKVGDVNGSAAVNLLGDNEDRTMVGDLVFNADDVTVEAGNTYTVEFKATDFNVSGYQFTMNFDKAALEFVEVVPGLADVANFGLTMVKEGVITTSWNSDEVKRLTTGEVVFGLTFKALSSGRLSNLININSRFTAAEAYNANAELMNVAMSFNNQLVAGGFELYQNTPNPFAGMTNIGFNLPEATSATLTISDVQGKVVKVIKVDAVKGFNQVTLKRGDLGATGVLYYRLDTNTDSATRKMILVD